MDNMANVSENAVIVGRVLFENNATRAQFNTAADRLFGASLMVADDTDDHIWLRYLSGTARELAYASQA